MTTRTWGPCTWVQQSMRRATFARYKLRREISDQDLSQANSHGHCLRNDQCKDITPPTKIQGTRACKDQGAWTWSKVFDSRHLARKCCVHRSDWRWQYGTRTTVVYVMELMEATCSIDRLHGHLPSHCFGKRMSKSRHWTVRIDCSYSCIVLNHSWMTILYEVSIFSFVSSIASVHNHWIMCTKLNHGSGKGTVNSMC